MDWLSCLVISALVLLSALVLAGFVAAGIIKKSGVLTPFRIVFGGVFISVFICLLPIFSDSLEGVPLKGLKTVAFSIHNTLQIFTVNTDRSIILQGIDCPKAWMNDYYSAYLSLLFLVAPALTFGFILSLFKSVSASIRYRVHYFSELYIFSELNEKSIALASDLRANHKHAAIVFTDVSKQKEDEDTALLDRARNLRAICFSKDILSINLNAHSKKAKIVVFVIGSDETKNVEQAMKLVNNYKDDETMVAKRAIEPIESIILKRASALNKKYKWPGIDGDEVKSVEQAMMLAEERVKRATGEDEKKNVEQLMKLIKEYKAGGVKRAEQVIELVEIIMEKHAEFATEDGETTDVEQLTKLVKKYKARKTKAVERVMALIQSILIRRVNALIKNTKELEVGEDEVKSVEQALELIENYMGNHAEFETDEDGTENVKQVKKRIEKYKTDNVKRVEEAMMLAEGCRESATGEDEKKNVKRAMERIEKYYKKRDHMRLYVFASRTDSEMLLTSASKGALTVRRINEARSLINRMLYEQGARLFETAKPTADGEKKISAVIVGLGKYGTEMLRALAWYCQMDGYQIEINAFDEDKNAEDRFKALAPELMSEELNGKRIPGESSYRINVHSGVDVTTKTFAEVIEKLTDTTFVFVSLSSDEMNIRTAVNLRMLFERLDIKPTIQTVVYNSDEKAALEGITNYRGQAYNIDCIGDINSSYSEAVVMNSELEAAALRQHLKWDGSKIADFWQYEYNYNSSVASAIHLKARIACGIPGADKKEEELTEEEKKPLAILEHRRWNAYMRAEGYVYRGRDRRNDLAKIHYDLVAFSELSEKIQKIDYRVGVK